MQTIVLPQAFRRMLPALGQRGRQLDQELVADAGGVLRGEVTGVAQVASDRCRFQCARPVRDASPFISLQPQSHRPGKD
jgi:hypothetical protein